VDKLIVACVQQRMRLPDTLDEHRDDLRRILRAVANKRARLVIFPELAAMMIAPSLMSSPQATLLKRADHARRRQASLWQKTTGQMAGVAARFFKADLRQLVTELLDTSAPRFWSAYLELFGGLAREFDMTLVAPSGYFPDPLDGVIRNIAAIFGPTGELLGYQAKGVLHTEDGDLAQPSNEWRVINTDLGRIGLMLGSDMLYPEVGRLLAYQGAEMLVGLGVATDRVLYEKLRAGMLARMQENQLFAAISFLVGPNEFGRRTERHPFMGKSAIFAPQELTPQSSGILVEMSNVRSESVLAAVWDFPALQELWENSETPVRSAASLEQMAPMLADLYQQINRLPKGPEPLVLPRPKQSGDPDVISLDALPVLASVTSRWPLALTHDNGAHQDIGIDESIEDVVDTDARDTDARDTDARDTDARDVGAPTEESNAAFLRSAFNSVEDNAPPAVEEETQEMDALLEPSPEEKDGRA
jgi:predicted amidohydrolase